VHLAEPYLYFANWRYDKAAGRLVLVDSLQQVKLEPRLHQLLNYFLAHPMQVISKDQLMDDVWPEGEGTDAAVMRAVASLRKILQPGLTGADPCIETLSKRGYRWTLAVEAEVTAEPEPAPVVLPVETLVAPPLLWPEAKMHQSSPGSVQTQQILLAKPQSTPSRWPFILATVVLLMLLLFGVALFLLSAGQQARQPLFSQLLNFSALKGQEQSALLSTDGTLMFYQYQLPGQANWQWLRQDVKNHKKVVSPATFTKMSSALWFDNKHLLFQASKKDECYFYLQHIDLINKAPEPLQPCVTVTAQGMVRDQQHLYWLGREPQTGAVQLWQQPLQSLNSAATARLLYQFTGQYRQATQLHLQEQQLYLIVEKDFYSNSLFRFDLHNQSMEWLKDFAFVVSDISPWQGQHLLLSSQETLLIYPLSSGKVIRLPSLQGEFWQADLIEERLLTAYVEAGNSDLSSLALDSHVATAQQHAPWLHSSKNEQLLAATSTQTAFVSERSGSQQIWWYQQEQLRQLTHLSGQRQIQQLVWWQQRLYALIDLQLYQVSLDDGSLTLSDIERPSRLQACADVLYWTQWTESGWQLWRRQQGEDDAMLLPDVVDVRCGPEQQLVLQKSDSAVLQLWLPGSGKFQPIDFRVDWRNTQPEQWLTRSDALYWLAPADGTTTLYRLPWYSDKAEQFTFSEGKAATALFADFNEGALYYQSEPQKQKDIVWLMQANKTPD